MLHSEYLSKAKDVVGHVQSTVRYRGLNTAGGWIRNPIEGNQKFIARINNMVTGAARSAARDQSEWTAQARVQELARLGKETDTGNCDELSSVAYLYLQEKGITPLDYFAVWRPGVIPGTMWGHAFVVLNRDPKVPLKDFATWSYQAVVCDPLYDRAADAGFLSTWYPRIFPLKEADLRFSP
jgi:hypothetical protein